MQRAHNIIFLTQFSQDHAQQDNQNAVEVILF
jgi:hypothetical protein